MFPKCFMKKVVVLFKSCYNHCNRKNQKIANEKGQSYNGQKRKKKIRKLAEEV